MKKILLVLLIIVPFAIKAQRVPNTPKVTNDINFDMSNITGTDTVLFYEAFGASGSVEADYTLLNDTTATIDLGGSDFGYTFNSLDTAIFPYILHAYDTTEVNGIISTDPITRKEATYLKANNYYASKAWVISKHPFTYIALKITKGNVTSGTLRIRYRLNWF